LFFTAKGRCFWKKVFEIPEGAKNSKGRAIQNFLNIDADDSVNAFIRIKNLTSDIEFINSHYLLFCTRRGVIKKTLLEAYSRPRQNGVNAITLHENDGLIQVRLTNGNNDVLIANRNGRAIRFNESKVRVMGRTAAGVKGMKLDGDEDEVVGMVCIKHPEKESILVVSEQGYGKRSKIDDYRITNRGGKGVKTLNVTGKTGKLVGIKTVTDENDLMIINKSGVTIRMKVADLNIIGRATQGVRLINLGKRNDEIASVCKVMSEKEEDEIANNYDLADEFVKPIDILDVKGEEAEEELVDTDENEEDANSDTND
jgi:DNA gyrase subunit A